MLSADPLSLPPTDVSPVKQFGPTWVLELFHGPTFAFKDVALQLLGNLFEYFLAKRKGQPDGHLTILGATSGDTGKEGKGRRGHWGLGFGGWVREWMDGGPRGSDCFVYPRSDL